MNRGGPLILSAEDDENDVLFIERAFAKNGVDNPIHASRNGADAIAYLQGTGKYSDRSKYPFPSMVITDIKMPGSDGFDFLRWMRSHPECCRMPVLVLSSSAEESDVRLAYELGANAFIKKPGSFEDLVRVVGHTVQFWESCEMPTLPRSCSELGLHP